MPDAVDGPSSAGAVPQAVSVSVAAAGRSVWHMSHLKRPNMPWCVQFLDAGFVVQRLTDGRQPTRILCCGHSLGAAVAVLSMQRPVHILIHCISRQRESQLESCAYEGQVAFKKTAIEVPAMHGPTWQGTFNCRSQLRGQPAQNTCWEPPGG